MRITLLGATRAHRDDGTPVPLGGARLRALLAALALRPGRTTGAGTLVAEVWDGDPPADAAGALQALVARLRRALGAGAVVSDGGGYRLAAAREDVDVFRFERLVADGTRASRDADPREADALLADALALWGGPPLADLPARTGEAARLTALRDDARTRRLTAGLALGRAAHLLPELAALCAEAPLNEPLHALHIRALRDTGRTADALNAYGVVRAAIADRLGADPGPELRALHSELLTGSPGTAQKSPEPPPETSRPRPGGNLRARLTSFVGRESDLRGIGDDLAAARLVTLTGPGGSGKTRLSQEAAERFGDRWPGGVWLAELAPVADGATVPEALLNALGLRQIALHSATDKALSAAEARDADPVRTLTEYCADRRLLLVLDNCEHVIGACADLAETLLIRCPGVTVLATSREPLGVPGELVRPVDPLPEPNALRLLADRGAAARPGFTPDDAPEACAEICRRLDGLPLAIELAAARLRSMTPRQIAERLDDRFRLLTAGSRTVLPRQQTLRAVVDWSWELLEPAERAVLRRLSVFSGGCDLAAAEAVCADDAPGAADDAPGARDDARVERRDVAALLGALVDKSLVLADLSEPDARYRTLETIGEYAAARLAESGEREATEYRHIDRFREWARTADPFLRGPEQLRWLEAFEREHDNLRAALRRAVDRAAEPEALQLVLACVWFWMLRNYGTELRGWLPAVAALGPDPFAEPAAPVVPLDRTPLEVELPFPPGQLHEARRWIRTAPMMVWEESLERLAHDREYGRAMLLAYPAELPQSGSRTGLTRPYAAFLTGDFDVMPRLLDELVDACRHHGRPWELAYALQLRAKALNDMDTERDFMTDVSESRELFAQVGDRWGMAEALSAQAESVGMRGDWQDTARCCREAMVLARELGAHQQVPELTVRLGQALLNGGELTEGERLLRAGIEDGLNVGRAGTGAVFQGRISLVACLGHQGRIEEAHTLVDLMLGQTADLPIELVRGVLLCIKGWLTACSGDGERAVALAREGIEALHGHHMADLLVPRIGVITLPVVTSLLTRVVERDPDGTHPRTAERLRNAVVLLGASGALRTATTPLERDELLRATEVCRARYGDAAFDAAYAEGGGLSPSEAAALTREALN